MLVYRICWPQYAKDLTGEGAYLNGGRWNFKGERMLYTATNPSLALLETLVHIPNYRITTKFCLITIELESDLLVEIQANKLPLNWQETDPPNSLKAIGSMFLIENKNLGLLVPSVVMPKDNNLLINPLNSEFKSVKILEQMELDLEKRLLNPSK